MKINKKTLKIVAVSVSAVIFTVTLAMFLWWNDAWRDFVAECYAPYEQITVDPLVEGLFTGEKDGYSYSVNRPDYLRTNGNMAVSDEEMNLLIIVPQKSGEEVYFVSLSGWEYKYPLRINPDGSPVEIGEYPDGARESLVQHEDCIQELVRRAQEWRQAAEKGDTNFFQYE